MSRIVSVWLRSWPIARLWRTQASAAPADAVIDPRSPLALDAPGQPFHDPAAREALFAALEGTVRRTTNRRLVRLPHHINDPAFAAALAAAFREIVGGRPQRRSERRGEARR